MDIVKVDNLVGRVSDLLDKLIEEGAGDRWSLLHEAVAIVTRIETDIYNETHGVAHDSQDSRDPFK